MALQFVLGGSGSGKSEYVKNLAIKIATADRKNNVFMIVPDQFTMQTQWQMSNAHPDGGIINIDVLSFSRLPRKVFEEVGQPKRLLLDDTGKCLLIKRGAIKIKDNLHVLSRGMDNALWSGEIKSAISEFMQYGIEPDDIDEVMEKCEGNSGLCAKLSDLKLLYTAFLSECSDRYITNEDLLDMFTERLPLSKKIAESVVIFDGFTGFTPIQIRAITAIILKAKDVIITFPFDNDLNENPYEKNEANLLFGLTRQNISDLLDKCKDCGIEVKKEIRLTENFRHKNNPNLDFLESRLFRAGTPDKIRSNGAIRIVRCADTDSECHVLCEEVLSFIQKNNLRYRDVAIICADMEKYRKSIDKYLTGYNVPFYMDYNRNINSNPLVKFICLATETLRKNFRPEEVIGFLRSGAAPFTDEEIDKLENYIYARGIKGFSKWKEEFVYPSTEMRRNDESLDELNGLRERLVNIFAPLIKEGRKSRKLSVWIKEIYEMLENSGVFERMNERAAELKEAGRYAQAMEYEGVYDKVIELFDTLCDLMGEEDYSDKELSDILKIGFNEIRVGVLPMSVDSILVGDLQRTRLKDIKGLFIVGVNDGNIPKDSSSGGIISLPEKEYLEEREFRLSPTPAKKAFIEQLYIYLGLTKPTDYLYMSFATVGNKGENLIPSYFTDVLKNMFEGLEIKDMTKALPRLFISDIKEETARLISSYVSETADENEEKRLFEDIAIIKSMPEGREWIDRIVENAFSEYKAKPINRETARKLYGDLMSVSISTLERFAACQYAHFVAYGLGLEEREEYGLESMDMGNINHSVLEEVGKNLKEKNLDFSSEETKLIEDEIEAAVKRITGEYNGDILKSDAKTAFYAKQLSRIMKRTVKTLGYQLSAGKFKPLVYEQGFKKNYEAPGFNGESYQVVVKGRIDRIDSYEDSSNNEYVKIVDYKSSTKDLDMNLLREGLSLQLAIYMKNAIEALKEKYPDKNVLPAAMLYYAINDPFIKEEGDTEAAIRKELMPKGIIVNDEKILESLDYKLTEAKHKSDVIPVSKKKDNTCSSASRVLSNEEFNSVLNEAHEKALSLAGEIREGEIAVNPVRDSKADACKYCSLRGICGFDAWIPGYSYRKINKNKEEIGKETT